MSSRQINRIRPDSGRPSALSSSNKSTCDVCCHAIPGDQRRAFYAIGPCNHPICYHCSAKMRVLCEQNECPICRQVISEVIFTEDPSKAFDDFSNKGSFYYNKKYKIYFETRGCLDTFTYLLEERCKKCKVNFESVHVLQDHLWEKHRLLLCELCVQNLKIFSDERRYYNTGQLEKHMLIGDPEDRSYQGHPACQLCNQRYVDSEELNHHLRREHYYCHLCDTNKIVYYSKYETLNEHFREDHFLCEEGSCKEEKFTSVFRTNIDLQFHKANVHCLTKSEAKHARTLSLDLTFNSTLRGPRVGGFNPQVTASFHEAENPRGGRRGRGGGDRTERGDRGDRGNDRNPPTIPEDTWMVEELENLGAVGPVQQLPNLEDFPCLGEPSRLEPTIPIRSDPTQTLSTVANRATRQIGDNPNAQLNSKAPKKHKFSTKVKESATFGRKDDEEFPALCLNMGPGKSNKQPKPKSESNAISLADAVKLNPKPPEKSTTQPSNSNSNINNVIKLTKSITNSSSNRPGNSAETQDPSGQDFALAQNDFPSLPFKVDGSKKKKKSLNILLASLNNSQPNPPPNYTSVRLVDSSLVKEISPSTSSKPTNGPSLEANMSGLLLKEDFPPLAGETVNSKQAKVNNKKETPAPAPTYATSNGAMVTTFSSLMVPASVRSSGLEKRNKKELSMEAVAQQLMKPTIAPSLTSKPVNEKSLPLEAMNNYQEANNIGSSRSRSDKSQKQLSVTSPSNNNTSNNQSKKRENFDPPILTDDPINSKTAKQSSKVSPTTSNRTTKQLSNGRASSPVNESVVTQPAGSYIYPKDFDERNRALFDNVGNILKDRFRDFDSISRAFFRDEITSHHYYNKCVEMFRNKLSRVLLDLIVLLPDIRKQKHLLAAHEASVKQRSNGTTAKKTGVWEIKTDSDLDVVVCPMCGQVLCKRDGPDHITKHQKIKTHP